MINDTDLPSTLTLLRDPERIAAIRQEELNNVLGVGPEKPMGFVTLSVLRIFNRNPQNIKDELDRKGIRHFDAMCPFGEEVIYAYDPSAVENILAQPDSQERIKKYGLPGWPMDAEGFVQKLSQEMAPRNLMPIVEKLFSDARKPFNGKRDNDRANRIQWFVDQCSAGIPRWFEDDLMPKEMEELSCRMTMEDIIALSRPKVAQIRSLGTLARYAVNDTGDTICLLKTKIIVKDKKGREDIFIPLPTSIFNLYPLLKNAPDYEPHAAAKLLYEENMNLNKLQPFRPIFKNPAKVNERSASGRIGIIERSMLDQERGLVASRDLSIPPWILKTGNDHFDLISRRTIF